MQWCTEEYAHAMVYAHAADAMRSEVTTCRFPRTATSCRQHIEHT